MNTIAKEVLEKIEKNGFEAYLVGGYPRNFLLNIETEDFDICTSAKKEDLENIFQMSFKDNFGSIVLNYKDKIFEITTYRKDIAYTGIRTPNIIYTPHLEDDVLRRDFTINTICMNYQGKIIDLLGGILDLNNKIIRSVGSSNKKIVEDPLRILRAIRFACVLGFSIDSELDSAIKNNNYRVSELSYFRKKQELNKIFNSPNIKRGIELLKQYNLLEYLDIQVDQVILSSSFGIWAQIKYSPQYPFSKYEQDSIEKIRMLITKGEISNYDLYLCGMDVGLIAGEILKIEPNNIRKRYLELPIKSRNEINVSYNDIVKYNKINANVIYSILEEKILNNHLKNDNKDIVNYLEKLASNDIDK